MNIHYRNTILASRVFLGRLRLLLDLFGASGNAQEARKARLTGPASSFAGELTKPSESNATQKKNRPLAANLKGGASFMPNTERTN
jgi:hypothetical protein